MRVLNVSLIGPTLLAVGLFGCAPPPPPPVVAAIEPPHLSTAPTLAPKCGKPAEKAAFGVAGLKTQLVVTAISCSANLKYNAFVQRYQKDLRQQDTVLSTYFSHTYGRSGTSQRDDYISALANQTSQVGLRSGTQFCQRSLAMFDDVMALKDGSAMAQYAVAQNFEQPLTVPDCSADATPPAKTPAVKKIVSQLIP